MRERMVVRMIAAQIPADLKQMRGRMMLESVHEFLGVDEVPCPACDGTGWLSRRRLERCPVCCGFRQVPVGLADWYRSQEAANHGRREEKNDNHNDTTSTTEGNELIQLLDAGPAIAELGAGTAAFSPAGKSA